MRTVCGLALFCGLASHVTYLRTGRLRHAVAANVWIVAGITFNEKTALVYAVLGIVAYGFLCDAHWAREGLAAAITSLLLVAIRNEWDLITWIAPRSDEIGGAS